MGLVRAENVYICKLRLGHLCRQFPFWEWHTVQPIRPDRMLGWLGVHAAPMQGLDIHNPGNSLNRISRRCRLDQAIWWLPHKGFRYRERRFGD